MFVREDGIACFHEEGAISKIQDIIRGFDPVMVVELGTRYGGFTSFIIESTSDKVKIYTFDITHHEFRNFPKRVKFTCEDIASSPSPTITKLLETKSRKILYCDNGFAIKEVRMYAPLLRDGDMLGVHDWNKEIRQEDVEDVLLDFVPCEHGFFVLNEFSSRFWIKNPERQKGLNENEDTSIVRDVQPTGVHEEEPTSSSGEHK